MNWLFRKSYSFIAWVLILINPLIWYMVAQVIIDRIANREEFSDDTELV